MNGIGNQLLQPYAAKTPAHVPRRVDQVISGFVRDDKNQKPGADVSRMRRALRKGSESLTENTPVSVVDSMKLYSMALKKQRETSKDSSLEKKRLKYSFKKISSKIISSKTSTMAREAVSQARREIQKLKAAKRTGKYDEEELEAALDHAKAMERIARKKARHLEEEEMAKRCSFGNEKAGPAAVDDEEPAEKEDPVKDEISQLREEINSMKDKADNGEYIESQNATNELISEITAGMEDMLEAIEGLNDLLNEIAENPVNMDPEDIRSMEIKHRNKEMKEITKADADYLKAIFEHYDRIRSDVGVSSGEIPEGSAPVSQPMIDVAL